MRPIRLFPTRLYIVRDSTIPNDMTPLACAQAIYHRLENAELRRKLTVYEWQNYSLDGKEEE